jgi:hypothetical protein
MATNFPASAVDDLDGNQRWVDGITIVTASPLNNIQDAIDALQAKVGVNASTVQSSIDFFMRKNYVKVSDQKTNASGGTFTQDGWRTRTLNTEDTDDGSLCSLSSNQITLAAGTYRCLISCPAYRVNAHAARLYNVTGSALLLMGTAEYTWYDSVLVTTRSVISGQFTVAAGQALEVQHYCTKTYATIGFGSKVFSDATPNIYTVAEFWKLY